MKLILYIYRLITGFMARLKEDHVGAYASQAALFMIMALFPMLILILNILRYTPVTRQFLIETVMTVIPSTFEELALTIINDVYQSANGTLLSLSVIFTIWSASRGILALIRGFTNITHTKENRNYFLLRLIASGYTVLFVLVIVLTLTLMVFGNSLLALIHRHYPLLYDAADWVIKNRGLYVPVFMTMLFLFMYRLGSKWKKIIAELSAGSIVFIRWLADLFLFLFLLCGSFFGKILFLPQHDHHCTADAVAIYMYVYYLYRCRDKYLLLYAFPAYEKKDKKKEAETDGIRKFP